MCVEVCLAVVSHRVSRQRVVCVAVCVAVSVAACCRVLLQCVAVCEMGCSCKRGPRQIRFTASQCVAGCCSMLPCVVACYLVLRQCVAACYHVLQHIVACCSVMQLHKRVRVSPCASTCVSWRETLAYLNAVAQTARAETKSREDGEYSTWIWKRMPLGILQGTQ